MRLSVNVITGSPARYYRAGEEIPDEEVPDLVRKYALRDDDDDARKPSTLARPKHAEKLRKRFSR